MPETPSVAIVSSCALTSAEGMASRPSGATANGSSAQPAAARRASMATAQSRWGRVPPRVTASRRSEPASVVARAPAADINLERS
jgi:hypothetical protein